MIMVILLSLIQCLIKTTEQTKRKNKSKSTNTSGTVQQDKSLREKEVSGAKRLLISIYKPDANHNNYITLAAVLNEIY